MENKKKIKSLKELKKGLLVLGLLTTGSLTLTSCGNSSKESTRVEVTQDELVKELEGEVSAEDTKVFESGEHYLLVRVPTDDSYPAEKVSGYSINNIPDGYEVYSITPYNEKIGYGSQTGGHDIWFVNTEPVKVSATYNKKYQNYGYYTFGEVLQKTK